MKYSAMAIAMSVALGGCMQGTSGKAELTPNQYARSAPQGLADSSRKGLETGISGGGLVGGAMGADLSRIARREALEAEYRALENTPPGEPVTWQAPSGSQGTVRAAQPYSVGSQNCRQYTHRLEAGGATQEARGTACRNPDGSWTLLG